jgi:hypothetical protein
VGCRQFGDAAAVAAGTVNELRSPTEDAYVLTDRLRLGRELPHPFVFDAEALALRTLTRLRYRLTHDLVQLKLYCLQFIYLKASERRFAWLTQCRRLGKDYEVLPASSEALIYIAMTRLMIRRLAS